MIDREETIPGYRGSRVYAQQARQADESIDGMLCLEMVGYRCCRHGCQKYPFPLMFMGYPKEGTFIGIVGNFKSRDFTRQRYAAFSKNPELPVPSRLSRSTVGWCRRCAGATIHPFGTGDTRR